jgi:hypothetical protein
MLQGILWLFDDPFSDLLLAAVFILAALQHRQMRLMQQRTNQLAFQVSELNALIRTISTVTDAPSVTPTQEAAEFNGCWRLESSRLRPYQHIVR